jgi:hypothetical protein
MTGTQNETEQVQPWMSTTVGAPESCGPWFSTCGGCPSADVSSLRRAGR